MEENNKTLNLIVKTWHVLVFIVGLVFASGGIYSLFNYRLTQAEERISTLETWKEARIELLHRVEIDVAEIKTKTNYIYDELVNRQDKIKRNKH